MQHIETLYFFMFSEGDYAVATGPSSQVVLNSKPFTITQEKLYSFCYYRPSALSNLAVIVDKDGIREKVFNTQVHHC